MFQLSKMLLDLVLFCCFLCVFLIRECFVLSKFVFHHEFGLYCFCCALSRSCRYHSKFRRFKPICFLILFVLVVEMHHSILISYFQFLQLLDVFLMWQFLVLDILDLINSTQSCASYSIYFLIVERSILLFDILVFVILCKKYKVSKLKRSYHMLLFLIETIRISSGCLFFSSSYPLKYFISLTLKLFDIFINHSYWSICFRINVIQ